MLEGGGLAGEVLEQFGKLIVSCDVFGGNIILAVLMTEKLTRKVEVFILEGAI